MLGQNEVQIADSAEFIRVVSAAVVYDRKIEIAIGTLVGPGPIFEMLGELRIRYDVCVIEVTNITDLVQHVLQYRLARDRQQRLGLIQC
jgi:hypothetical protein